MSDLLDLYLSLVHLALGAVDRVVEGLGLQGGYLDRFVDWLAADANVALAAIIAALVAAAWAGLAGAAVSWLDLRIRARLEGRVGPSYRGLGGVMQGWADWAKLMLRRSRTWTPSSAGAAVSGALVIASLVLIPAGGMMRVIDPVWSILAATAMLAVAPIPCAIHARWSEGWLRWKSATDAGLLITLSIAAPLMIAEAASADGLVRFQQDNGWFALLAPVAFILFLYSLTREAGRLEQDRALARRIAGGDAMALARYSMAGRQFALALLGAVVFLGGWAGPVADGSWWTYLKAAALVTVASFLSAVYPMTSSVEALRAVRTRWLPLAGANLLVIAVLLEVMA